MDLIDQRYKDQDLKQEQHLDIFKDKLRDDLSESFERFRQEIEPGSEEQGALHLKDSSTLYNNMSHNPVISRLHCMRHCLEFGRHYRKCRCRKHVTYYPRLDHLLKVELMRDQGV